MSSEVQKKLRNSIGFDGLISTIIGLLILIWPDKTAQLGTIFVAAGFVIIYQDCTSLREYSCLLILLKVQLQDLLLLVFL